MKLFKRIASAIARAVRFATAAPKSAKRKVDMRSRKHGKKRGWHCDRPALFTSPKHFERHGTSLSAEKIAKAERRHGVRPCRSNLRRSERRAAS